MQTFGAVVATARNPQAIINQFGERPSLLARVLDVTEPQQAAAAVPAAIARF